MPAKRTPEGKRYTGRKSYKPFVSQIKFLTEFFGKMKDSTWSVFDIIIYPMSLIPEKWRWLLLLNPLAGFIEGFRAACFGKSVGWTCIGISATLIILVFILPTCVFRKMEDNLADIV